LSVPLETLFVLLLAASLLSSSGLSSLHPDIITLPLTPDIFTLVQHPDVFGLTIFTRPGYTPAKLDIHSLYNPSSADRSRCSELSSTYLHIWNHDCHPQILQ